MKQKFREAFEPQLRTWHNGWNTERFQKAWKCYRELPPSKQQYFKLHVGHRSMVEALIGPILIIGYTKHTHCDIELHNSVHRYEVFNCVYYVTWDWINWSPTN